MSYVAKKRYGRAPARKALSGVRGGLIRTRSTANESVGDVISDLESALSEGTALASDPYMPEVVCHIEQLSQIHNGQAVQACAEVAYGTASPAGLGNFILPLRAFVYLQQNPWAYALLVGVVFGIPMYIGYDMGYTDGKKRGGA
jgi:hypothetical protein